MNVVVWPVPPYGSYPPASPQRTSSFAEWMDIVGGSGDLIAGDSQDYGVHQHIWCSVIQTWHGKTKVPTFPFYSFRVTNIITFCFLSVINRHCVSYGEKKTSRQLYCTLYRQCYYRIFLMHCLNLEGLTNVQRHC